MLNNLIFILISALCIHVSESGPWCYSCEKVFLPAICGLAQQCANSEICFTALHEGLNGGKQYRSGCTPASKCSKNVTRRAIEKRDNPETCNECCSGDFCNSKLCGGIAIIKSDQKHCLKCEAVQKTTDCDQFELCGQDQQCFVKAVDHFNQKFFAMGCQDKTTCTKDNDLCCDTDMCNAGANVTVTTAAPTTSPQSTPPVTTVQTTATALPTTTAVTTMPTTKQATTTTPKPTTTATPTTTTAKQTTTTPKPTTTTSKPTTTTSKPTTTTPIPTTTTSKPTTTTPKPTTTTSKPTTTTPKPTTTSSKPTTTTAKPTTTTVKPKTTTPIPTTTVTTTTLPTTQGVPPKISNVKPSVEVTFHDNITLVCDVTGSPKPTVSWNYDKSRIYNARMIGNNLLLQHVTKLNEGPYECFAENNHGTDQETTNVTVKVPVKVKVDEPVIAIKPTDVTGIVRLKCTGSGDPKPNITWSKLNMAPIVTDSSHMVMSGGEVIIHGITPINKLDFTGVYVCKGDNKVDKDIAYQIIAGYIPYSLSEDNPFDKFGTQPGEAFQAYCAPGKSEPDGSPINKEFNLDDKICVAARKVGAIGKGAGDVTWMIKSNGHPEIIDQAKGKIEFT